MKRLGFFILIVYSCLSIWGQDTIGVQIYFRQSYSLLEPNFANNQERLDKFISQINEYQQPNSSYSLRALFIEGTASPEGNYKLNQRLAQKRANRIVEYLKRYLSINDSIVHFKSLGIDWEGLTRLVEASDMPHRDPVLDILTNTPEWVIHNGKVVDSRMRQLQNIAGGRAWWYMYEHFFPELRNSGVRVICEVVRHAPHAIPADSLAVNVPALISKPLLPVTITNMPQRKPFYMAIKTNLLYDATLVPNIGAEFYLNKGWSIGANWMYAWWNVDCRDWYWRTYGGELAVRKYFGAKAKEKPLQGHHLGIYGEVFTYDFEVGGRGYIGGKPGGAIWDKANYGAGIEYGYSLPITRRLNLDFVIGIGYQGGEYWEYLPIDNHYVWQVTKKRNYWGPTKAEISLVWLIGNQNFNRKGGKR